MEVGDVNTCLLLAGRFQNGNHVAHFEGRGKQSEKLGRTEIGHSLPSNSEWWHGGRGDTLQVALASFSSLPLLRKDTVGDKTVPSIERTRCYKHAERRERSPRSGKLNPGRSAKWCAFVLRQQGVDFSGEGVQEALLWEGECE